MPKSTTVTSSSLGFVVDCASRVRRRRPGRHRWPPLGTIGGDPLDRRHLMHLHFELWRDHARRGATDPAPYLRAMKRRAFDHPLALRNRGAAPLRSPSTAGAAAGHDRGPALARGQHAPPDHDADERSAVPLHHRRVPVAVVPRSVFDNVSAAAVTSRSTSCRAACAAPTRTSRARWASSDAVTRAISGQAPVKMHMRYTTAQGRGARPPGAHDRRGQRRGRHQPGRRPPLPASQGQGHDGADLDCQRGQIAADLDRGPGPKRRRPPRGRPGRRG